MRTIDILRRSAKSLRQSKVRTALTCLAISVGAVTISLALAAGEGGRNYTDDMINTSGDATAISIYPHYESSDEEDTLAEYGAPEETAASPGILNEKDVRAIQSLAHIKKVIPMYDISAEYATSDYIQKKLVAPVSIKADTTEMKLAAGKLVDFMPAQGEAVLSEEYVTQFGFTSPSDAIGKTITLHIKGFAENATAAPEKDVSFKIAAVDTKTDTTLYYSPAIRIAATDGKAIYQYESDPRSSDEYYGITALMDSPQNSESVKQELEAKGYQVYTLEDTRSAMMQVVNIAQWGMAGFGALALIAAVFGIINTQYISVLERTQQIGLMKALGARRKDISRLFMFEAAWIGFFGGLIGIIVSLGVSLLNPVIAGALHLEKGTKLLLIDPLSSILLIVVLMVVAMVSGFFPARKAAKLNPIEALRTE